MNPVSYLKEQLGVEGDFLHEWKRLEVQDKVDLKKWAQEEMKELNIDEDPVSIVK